MYIYVYKSRGEEGKYIFELFNVWEEKMPNCRLLNELDYYLADVVQFNNFNEIIEFVISLKDSLSSEDKKGSNSEETGIPDDAKIDRRTYYYFSGLAEKVLKEKIESLIK